MNDFILKIVAFVFVLTLINSFVVIMDVDPSLILLALWLWKDLSESMGKKDD